MKLVSVETPEKSVCKMTFSASAEELEAASNAVYERTRATYTIKGFAKGEADRAQIEADRGEHTFWYDAINDLMDKDVPALYDAAMAEHGFHAVDEPVYDLVSVKKDEGFVATATTALQPELKLTQTTGFKAECVTPEVTDKEIDAVLERRRAVSAELVPHKGPAVKGNIVHIDYEGLLDGKPFQGGSAQNQTLQLGSGRMIPGFEEGILGHKGGEEFDIFVTFPARYHVSDLAGKPVVFKIKLHDVCVRQLPALNSDFAKKVGKVDTMEAFREQVRKQLHDGKHASALNRAKDQVLTQLATADEGADEEIVSQIKPMIAQLFSQAGMMNELKGTALADPSVNLPDETFNSEEMRAQIKEAFADDEAMADYVLGILDRAEITEGSFTSEAHDPATQSIKITLTKDDVATLQSSTTVQKMLTDSGSMTGEEAAAELKKAMDNMEKMDVVMTMYADDSHLVALEMTMDSAMTVTDDDGEAERESVQMTAAYNRLTKDGVVNHSATMMLGEDGKEVRR